MNVFVTINVHVQLKAVEIEAAGPLIRLGNISPIISHGIGPNPIEKLTTYTISAKSGIHPGTSIPLKSYKYRYINYNLLVFSIW